MFRTEIFDYEKSTEWKYLGDKPAIIMFSASWCNPCKVMYPVMEELSKEYEGKVNIYKVDTESDSELSPVFGIRSIPTFLFIPMEGQPSMASGSQPKANIVKLINNVLKVD
jgi:thioredoxin